MLSSPYCLIRGLEEEEEHGDCWLALGQLARAVWNNIRWESRVFYIMPYRDLRAILQTQRTAKENTVYKADRQYRIQVVRTGSACQLWHPLHLT